VFKDFLLFLFLMFVLAALVREDFVFTIFYLMAGAYLVGGWWFRKSIDAISFKRIFDSRAFLDEEVPVTLEIENKSWLPALWLRVYDGVPVDLSINKALKQIVSLPPYGRFHSTYYLQARKRGYYKIGPVFASAGDLLGLHDDRQSLGAADYLTVYPRIIPLTHLKLPSNSPMGTMRHTQPIFEDPNRVLSKRDYVAGDSLRRVDWKATATTGRLQVKQFEPSIALETVIFLNLNSLEYELRSRFDTSELAIVIAASIANWVTSKKQSIGMFTNGLDPLGSEDGDITSNMPLAQALPARKGRGHLMRILDILARIQMGESLSFVELLRRNYLNLPWGTTLVLVTSQADDELFDILFQVRRAGLNLVLILTGDLPYIQEIRRRAEYFDIPVYSIRTERELDIWRR